VTTRPLLTDEEVYEMANRLYYEPMRDEKMLAYRVGGEDVRSIYEADRAKLLDRVAELEADNQVLRDAVAVAIPMIAKSELAEWEKLLGGINPPIPLPEKGDAG